MRSASAAMQRPTALALWAVTTPAKERTALAAQSRVGRGRLAVPAAGANRRERARVVTGALVLGARANASQCTGLPIPCHRRGQSAEAAPRANEVSPAWEQVRRGETDW